MRGITIKYRKRKLLLNSISSIVYQIVAIFSGLILPRLFLEYYGSEINGLISSITQFLGFIALIELGIGAVIQSELYKPLSVGDEKKVSEIIKSGKVFFNKIATFFLIYIVLLVIFLPKVNETFNPLYVIMLILIIAMSSIAQYFFGITYQILLSADQKQYVATIISIFILILNTIISILLIVNSYSIHVVKFLTTILYLSKPFILNYYVKKNYNIDSNITYSKEPIKQKWNGIAQHVASFILNNTDIMILTIMTDLVNVSIYSIYNLVVTAVKQFILAAVSGIQSLFGHMLANKEYDALEKRFLQFEWVMHTSVTLLFSSTLVLITPFIQVYTNGITDADYNRPVFGIVLTLSTAAYCLRLPYNTMVLAAGHYKQTQNSAIIEVVINIVTSLVLVSKYGLVGVAAGTLFAMLYRTIYLARYISYNIINYKFTSFLKHIGVNILVLVIVICSFSKSHLLTLDYLSWFIFSLKVFILTSIVSIGINFLFYKEFMKNSFIKFKIK